MWTSFQRFLDNLWAIVIGLFLVGLVYGLPIYVVIHFIIKYW